MPTIIVTKGLPASGKDTWATEYIIKDPYTKRVNKDLLREMLDAGVWSKHNEQFILKIRDIIIQESLANGHNIIVSDTNLHPKHLQRFKEIAKLNSAKVEVVDHFLSVLPEECVKRDLKRPNSVGSKVIWQMYNQFVKPESKIIQDKNLPKAVIFDMDGTLAKMTNRTAFEWDKVEYDDLNQAVFEVYKMYKNNGYKIIILTARDGICEEKTKSWLAKHDIIWDYFDIRPAENIEQDAVIKKIMLEKILQKFYIEVIYDDRDQVVQMWRDLGLTCFQVNYGDF